MNTPNKQNKIKLNNIKQIEIEIHNRDHIITYPVEANAFAIRALCHTNKVSGDNFDQRELL